MAVGLQRSRRDRIRAALATALIVGALGYGLIMALAVHSTVNPGEPLKLFTTLSPPPPAPEPPRRESMRRRKPNGKASPANLRATATPVVVLPLPPEPTPVIVASKPAKGVDPHAGASDRPGPGSGSGGRGAGTGSGDAGNGSGDGDGPELIRGEITQHDYPRDALRAGAGGTVLTRFTVGVNGRVSGCVVTRSSGDAELDATTCRLITQRFRFRPARDRTGRPVADEAEGEQRWSTSRRDANNDLPDD